MRKKQFTGRLSNKDRRGEGQLTMIRNPTRASQADAIPAGSGPSGLGSQLIARQIHGAGTGFSLQFLQKMLDMLAYGARGDAKDRADFAITFAACDPGEHLTLPAGKAGAAQALKVFPERGCGTGRAAGREGLQPVIALLDHEGLQDLQHLPSLLEWHQRRQFS
jgi:hypothetical protein